MADIKWLEITVNTTPDQLDQVSAKLTAAGMDGLCLLYTSDAADE